MKPFFHQCMFKSTNSNVFVFKNVESQIHDQRRFFIEAKKPTETFSPLEIGVLKFEHNKTVENFYFK